MTRRRRGDGTAERRVIEGERVRGAADLATAVRKMTSLPASVFHLKSRGLLREGYWADITVFDPEESATPPAMKTRIIIRRASTMSSSTRALS